MSILGVVATPALVAGLVAPALAHEGGTMGISLSAERLPPGGPIEIIGTDFAPGESLQIRLVGPTGEWILPNVTTGPDGHFAVVLSLPPDAAAGSYMLDAISTSGIIQRETFQVDPTAPAPALTPSPAGPVGAPESVDLGGSVWALVPLVVLAVVAGAFAWVVVRRRPRGAPLDSGPAAGDGDPAGH